MIGVGLAGCVGEATLAGPETGAKNDTTNTNGVDADGCSAESKKVYLVDANNKFSSFDPMTKTVQTIGTLACPAMEGAAPFSMGIDRTPMGWVLYNSGEMFKVDPKTAACTKTGWVSREGFALMGMGFSTNAAGSTEDTLFVAGVLELGGESTLGTLDTAAMQAKQVGMVQGNPELTGTGNAELWGWFPDEAAPRVDQLDKASGKALKTFNLPTLAGVPLAWAFAAWGGDFWIFLSKDEDLTTSVYQIDGTNGQIKSTTPMPGNTIVGAGVSTCAPTVLL